MKETEGKHRWGGEGREEGKKRGGKACIDVVSLSKLP